MSNPQIYAKHVTRDPGPFLSSLKCCTYFPFIPNFTLGSLTTNGFNLARTSGLLLPLGLYPTPERQALIESFGVQGFGRKAELLCPFFNTTSNFCSIWNYRPGVCTTYFCISDREQNGLEFWSDVEAYLNHFEWILASEVFRRLDLGENEMAFCQALTSSKIEPSEQIYLLEAAWGKWFLKEAEFFQLASTVAQNISDKDLNTLLQPEFLDLETKINRSLLGT